MAIATQRLATAAGGLVTIDLEYDDATMRATAVLVTNGLSQPIYATASRGSNVYGQVFQPGTTRIDLPQQASRRIDVGWWSVAGSRLTGFDLDVRVPWVEG